MVARCGKRAGQVRSANRRDGSKPGVGTGAGAGRYRLKHFARTGDRGLNKNVTDALFIKVLVGTSGFLHVRDVQDALGTVRSLFISGNADEKHADETEQNRDDEGNLDKGKTGLFLDVVQFHYLVLLYVVVVVVVRAESRI